MFTKEQEKEYNVVKNNFRIIFGEKALVMFIDFLCRGRQITEYTAILSRQRREFVSKQRMYYWKRKFLIFTAKK